MSLALRIAPPAVVVVVVLLVLSAARPALAQPEPTFVTDSHENVPMEVGETRLMSLSKAIIRVSVADPEVADVQVVTPLQVLITAKSVGFTHLILWSSNEMPLVVAVSATRNLDQLRDQFKRLFPGSDIKVSAVGDLIVLSGSVSDLRLPARAAEVAQLHSERVANLIQVTGDQQVQLDVRFAEVSRTGLRSMGMNFLWQDNARGRVGGMVPYGVAPGAYRRVSPIPSIPGTREYGQNSLYDQVPPFVGDPAHGNAFNFFFSTSLRDFPFSVILGLLSQQGLARVLAEPTLVALSGQEAEFHSGGEVPIVIPQTLGTVQITFKKFGVQLRFNPTVLSDRMMSLKLGIEVSEPDPTSSVTIQGFSVPGFRTRNSETTVRLRDGQSFAIAGLLSDNARNIVSKVPGIGDLPLIGPLFRSTSYQHEETELLMVVTAHLVKPLQPNEVPLMPGEDEYNDPNDFELFVLGKLSSDKREAYESGRRPPQNDPTTPWPEVERRDEQSKLRTDDADEAHAESEKPPLQTADANQLDGPIGPIGFIRN